MNISTDIIIKDHNMNCIWTSAQIQEKKNKKII